MHERRITRARFLANAAAGAAGVAVPSEPGRAPADVLGRDAAPQLGLTYRGVGYKGAPRRGGLGWNVVDYDNDPPRIARNLVRSERTQAVYITRLLEVFEAMRFHSATIYNFVTPDAPHRSDPRYDLDVASYAIVKPIWKTRDRPTADWHWEPKEAFHAVARLYGRAKPAEPGAA